MLRQYPTAYPLHLLQPSHIASKRSRNNFCDIYRPLVDISNRIRK